MSEEKRSGASLRIDHLRLDGVDAATARRFADALRTQVEQAVRDGRLRGGRLTRVELRADVARHPRRAAEQAVLGMIRRAEGVRS